MKAHIWFRYGKWWCCNTKKIRAGRTPYEAFSRTTRAGVMTSWPWYPESKEFKSY